MVPMRRRLFKNICLVRFLFVFFIIKLAYIIIVWFYINNSLVLNGNSTCASKWCMGTVSNFSIGTDMATKIYNTPSFPNGNPICTSKNCTSVAPTSRVAMNVPVFPYDNHSFSNGNSICTSTECLRSASNFRLAMDMSVDPCDDFYLYTCGHWSEEHPNHDWYPHFSTSEIIEERISIAARKFLMQANRKKDPLPVKQSRNFYQSCMDVEKRDKLGLTAMYKYLKKANLPLVPTFFKDPQELIEFDWKQADVNLKRLFGINLFIGFTVDADEFNSTNNVMYMGSPFAFPALSRSFRGKGMSTNQWQTGLGETSYKTIVSHILKIVLKKASKTPIRDVVIEDATANLWDFEHIIRMLSTVEYSIKDIRKFPIRDIQKETDEYFKEEYIDAKNIWEPYLKMMFTNITNVTLDLEKKDLIYTTDGNLEYLHKMAARLESSPNVAMELYTWWSAVQFMIMETGTEIKKFLNEELYSTVTTLPESLDCAELVIEYMAAAVTYGIANKTSFNATKRKVEQMMYDIKAAFAQTVKNITWMDDVTKQVTLKKNKEMKSFIGFPDWMLKKKEVIKYYKNIKIRKNRYLDNIMEFVSSSFPSKLSSLRIANGISWKIDPTTVNAFYYAKGNSMYVPFAILTYPMYDLGLEVLNYGSTGSILGHELTHGFDNDGRLYDQFGNFQEWWTNDTIESYVNKTECFVTQYNSYKFPQIDEHVQGKATLGENIADNGGLHAAYVAYQNYLKTHETDQKLPGFENFTNEQMFFIAFASSWCEEINIYFEEMEIQRDPHSPSPVRVLGVLQNSEDFSKAFGCPKGSSMNPNRPKCRLW